MSPSLHDHDHVLPLQCTQFPRDVCIETLCFSYAHAADHAVYNSIMGCAHTSVRVITLAGLLKEEKEKNFDTKRWKPASMSCSVKFWWKTACGLIRLDQTRRQLQVCAVPHKLDQPGRQTMITRQTQRISHQLHRIKQGLL
jgi:hypothetical protein